MDRKKMEQEREMILMDYIVNKLKSRGFHYIKVCCVIIDVINIRLIFFFFIFRIFLRIK